MAKPRKESPNVRDVAKPLSEHQWGISSKFCEGRLRSLPIKNESVDAKEEPNLSDDDELDSLEHELATLSLEEERLAKQRKKIALRKQIEEKKAKIATATWVDSEGQDQPLATVKDLRRVSLQDIRTPQDGILDPLQAQQQDKTTAAWNITQFQTKPPHSSASLPGTPLTNGAMESTASEMFLRPAQLPKDENSSNY